MVSSGAGDDDTAAVVVGYRKKPTTPDLHAESKAWPWHKSRNYGST